MGATISELARDAQMIMTQIVRAIFDRVDEELTGEIPLRRRLSLRNADPTLAVTASWASIQILSCEEGTECKVYIYIYNDRGIKVLEITIYEDTETNSDAEIKIVWTNPRSGLSDEITFTYPVHAEAIINMFI